MRRESIRIEKIQNAQLKLFSKNFNVVICIYSKKENQRKLSSHSTKVIYQGVLSSGRVQLDLLFISTLFSGINQSDDNTPK